VSCYGQRESNRLLKEMTIVARNKAAVLQDEDDKLPWKINFEGRLAKDTTFECLGCLLRNWYCIEP